MANFRLTPRAKADLRSIWRYTVDEWNEAQAERYILALDQRFSWLASRPKAGKHRIDIEEGYYCFPQGKHLIFYLIRDGGIDIIGIPHKAMDVLRYFDDDE